jgi:ParB/RepB/Spo0J family partition protein
MNKTGVVVEVGAVEMPAVRGALVEWVGDREEKLELPAVVRHTVRAICKVERDGGEGDLGTLVKLLDQGNETAQKAAASLRKLVGAKDPVAMESAVMARPTTPAPAPVHTVQPPSPDGGKKDGVRPKSGRQRKSTPPSTAVPEWRFLSIPFTNIAVGPYNRSYEVEADQKFDKELQASLKRDGLLAPIVLRPFPGKAGCYELVAGVHRFRALQAMAGAGGLLNPGQFVIREDLTTDESAIRASVAENELRRGVSPYEKARQAARLIGDRGMTQEAAARLLGETREAVGVLVKLAKSFPYLPESWREDLRQSPGCDSNRKPVITPTHWREISSVADCDQLPPEVIQLMEKARDESMSVSRLKKAVAALKNGGCQAEQPEKAATPEPRPLSPPEQILFGISLLKKAQAVFEKAGGDLAPLTAALIEGARDRLAKLVPAEEERAA